MVEMVEVVVEVGTVVEVVVVVEVVEVVVVVATIPAAIVVVVIETGSTHSFTRSHQTLKNFNLNNDKNVLSLKHYEVSNFPLAHAHLPLVHISLRQYVLLSAPSELQAWSYSYLLTQTPFL